MKTKTMVVSIVTTMVVMLVFASTAMAITVDGDPSDWNPDDKLCDDEDVRNDGTHYTVYSTGYNITALWACIEDGVFYARLDVLGVAGDTDNDGDDTTVASEWEYPGVGEGGACVKEQYYIEIDADNGGRSLDYTLLYCAGGSRLEGPDGTIPGATTNAAHAGNTVELSVVIDEHCDIDPTGYCVYGWADTQETGDEDPVGPECCIDEPPEVVCKFIRTTCEEGTLTGEGSSDDGTIVEYAWDFYNDGTYDAYGETVSYKIVGTHEVRLMVTDDLGQTANCTLTATVTPSPDAVLKADGGDGPVNLPSDGKTVTFDGTESSAVAPAVIDESLCKLVIPGVGTYTGLGPWDVDLNLPCGTSITATLTVVDNFGCITQDTVVIRGPICVQTPTPPPSEVPTSTPVGIVALVGLLGIAGGIRLLNRGKRS